MPKGIPELEEEQRLECKTLGEPAGPVGLGWQLYGPCKSLRHDRAHPCSNDPCLNEGFVPTRGVGPRA